MKYLLINIIIITIGVCSQFELGEFYVFKDPEGRHLLRGQLSVDNSFLSAEVLYDGDEASRGKREIILFEFGDSPVSPDSGFSYRDRSTDDTEEMVYDGYLVNWSSFSDSEVEFSYFHYKSYGKNKGLQFRKSGFDEDEDPPYNFYIEYDVLSLDEDLWGENALNIKTIFDFLSIKDHHLYGIDEDEENAYFITYLDKANKTHIATTYSASNSILFDPDWETQSIANPEGIRVTRRGTDYDAVVTFNTSSKYEQDIYYFCDILYEAGIKPKLKPLGIFPRTSDYQLEDGSYAPIRKQLEPSFSHDGRYVAFLNQSLISNKKLDLYAFDTDKFFHVNGDNIKKADEKKRDKFCYYEDSSNQMSQESSVQLIDTDLVSFIDFETKVETAKDYAWHPDYNVIFYIKKYISNEQENYQLKSYDFINNEHTVMLDSQDRLGYLSISDDGRYLIFSFIVLDKEFDNCRGCNDEDVYSKKIAVAELIKNK